MADQPKPTPQQAPMDAGTAVAQFNSREPGKMMMRNVMTGAIEAADPAGKDTYGRPLYHPRPGYEPVGNHTVAEDGKWVEVTPQATALDRGHNVQGMSGAKAHLATPPENAQQARENATKSAQHPEETGIDTTEIVNPAAGEPRTAAPRGGRPGR